MFLFAALLEGTMSGIFNAKLKHFGEIVSSKLNAIQPGFRWWGSQTWWETPCADQIHNL